MKSYDINIFDNYLGKQENIIRRKLIIKVSSNDNNIINEDLFKEKNNIIIPNNYEIIKEESYFQNNNYINELKINFNFFPFISLKSSIK